MIRTSVPSDVRRPGTYAEIDVTSRSRGLVPITRRIAIIGARLKASAWVTLTAYVIGDWVTANGSVYRATVAGNSGAVAPTHTSGTAVDGTVTWLYVQPAEAGVVATPVQMFTDADGDIYFGRGSEIALLVRAAFSAAASWGAQPEIWAVAVEDAAGARALKTLTVTGPAAAAGDIHFSLAGRAFRVGVSSGDTAATIAAAIKSAVDKKLADLPVSASAAAGVVSLTANNGGVNGNDIRVSVTQVPSGVAIAVASPTAGSGSYDITASLDTLVARVYHAIVIANHLAADVTDLKAYIDARSAPAIKAWPMAYLAETGTLSTATTLGTGSNRMEIHILSCEDCPNLPGELAARAATIVEASRAGYNHDNTILGGTPPPDASVYATTEIETALGAGVTPLIPTDEGDALKIVRLVTTKTTENGVPFEHVIDSSTVRAIFYSATQVDIALSRMLIADAKKDAAAKATAKSVALDTLREVERLGIIQNVEDHRDEILVEDDLVVVTRLNVAVPHSVVPDLHQLVSKHILLQE